MKVNDIINIINSSSKEIKEILIETLGLPDFLKTKWEKHRGKAKEYKGEESTENFWKDLLGPSYAFEENMKRSLYEYDHIIFEDVTITEWVPRAPGLFYTRAMWKERTPEDVRLRSGDLRLAISNGKRLFSLHWSKEFVAHPEISRGIPIAISETTYKKVKDIMNLYGAVHLEKISATLSSYTPSIFTTNLLWPNGWPKIIPTVNGILNIKHPGTPDPLLGTAWTVYKNAHKEEVAWYHFWTGIDYHEISLAEAIKHLKELAPQNATPLIDFDAMISHFPDAPFNPNNIIDFNKSLSASSLDVKELE